MTPYLNRTRYTLHGSRMLSYRVDRAVIGSQRCTLRHLMPLYNVQLNCTPTFHYLCFESHIIGDFVLPLRKFRKIEQKPVELCPDPEIKLETPCPAVSLTTTRPTGQVLSRVVGVFTNIQVYIQFTPKPTNPEAKIWKSHKKLFNVGIDSTTRSVAAAYPATATNVNVNFSLTKHQIKAIHFPFHFFKPYPTLYFSPVSWVRLQTYKFTCTLPPDLKQQFMDHINSCVVRESKIWCSGLETGCRATCSGFGSR
ncbi:hypothetical protein SFRURICE_014161 [Spodoptera frugiperda]|nr:hypothetical protein SFRURICE_014161 [Spodoptera frugiperda]